jgi:hypothetical protein
VSCTDRVSGTRKIGVHLRLTAVNAFTSRVLPVTGLHQPLGLPACSDNEDLITIP